MMKRFFRWMALVLVLCGLLTAAGAEEEAPRVTLSLGSGFYQAALTLEITCDAPDAAIYYTTDGSVPDETDTLYAGPIALGDTTRKHDPMSQERGLVIGEEYLPKDDFPSAHAIRAVGILPDGSRTAVACGTYFVGYDRQELYGDTPIVSLMMEAEDLFDYETGIYVRGKFYDDWVKEQTEAFESWEGQGNYTQRGRDWERPVAVELMEKDGTGFMQDMGVRIKGGASRGSHQKSLRLIARDDYGQKNVKYPVFPGNICEKTGEVLAKYKSFTLRNGGNDCDFGKIRDPYIQRLAAGLRVETAANRPVIAFINGEFWGIYTLNEEYSDNYIEYHYGIDNKNVITFKNNNVEDGEEEDGDLYWAMFDYITQNDMSDPAAYEKACELLDMGSFADYVALQLYIYNEDGIFENNNWQMWRVRKPGKDDHPYADGKWRMMVFDTDFSSGIYADGTNFTDNNLKSQMVEKKIDSHHPANLVRSLVKNKTFRKELVVALCDMRNQVFLPARTKPLLDAMTDAYLPYAPDTFRRFGPMWVAQWSPENHFSNELKQIGVFFNGRYNRFINMVKNVFDLNNAMSVTIKVNDGEKGAVYLNGRDIPITKALNGQYFMEYPITVTAVPAQGATFVGWECGSAYANVVSPDELTTEIRFSRSFTVKAIFE